MASLSAYLTQPGYKDGFTTVHGIEVAYAYEPADRDTGLPEAYVLSCVKMGGQWIALDAFAEDFWLMLEEAIPAAVESEVAEARLP